MGKITLHRSISQHLAMMAQDFSTETFQDSTRGKGVTRKDLRLVRQDFGSASLRPAPREFLVTTHDHCPDLCDPCRVGDQSSCFRGRCPRLLNGALPGLVSGRRLPHTCRLSSSPNFMPTSANCGERWA